LLKNLRESVISSNYQSRETSKNILVSKTSNSNNEWLITTPELIKFFENNTEEKFFATNLLEALQIINEKKGKDINIVAHGSSNFLALGDGYTKDLLEIEFRNYSSDDSYQQNINLWSCFGGATNGIRDHLEKCLDLTINAKDSQIGKGVSLDLNYETKLTKTITNLPINLHTNSVGFDVIDNGNGTFGLVVYYGTWHSGSSSQSTEGALSLYTLVDGGSSSDVNDYTVEAYGQGGAVNNQTYYFTNPPKNTGNITFTSTDFSTTSTTYIEANGIGATGKNDLEDKGFTPGTNIFFAINGDSTLYSYNSTDGSGLASGFSGIYGYQSAYIPTISAGTYRPFYDGKGAWDSVDPLNAPAITAVFEPISAIQNALLTIDGSGDITFGTPPKILINSIDGDNGSSTSDFVTSGRGVVIQGTYDASLNQSDVVVNLTDASTSTTTTFNSSSPELTFPSTGNWKLSLTSDLSPDTYTIQSSITDGGSSYSDSQSLSIVAASIQSITTDDGISSTDFKTTDTSLLLNGIYSSATATDIKVSLQDSGNNYIINSQSPTSTIGDNWVYDATSTSLSLGTYTVTVDVSDNSGSYQATQSIQIIDGPTSPQTTAITDDNGINNTFITTDTTITISGTFDVSDDSSNSDSDGKIQITLAGVTYTDTGTNDLVVDYSNGTWSFTPSSALSVGSYTVLAEVTDSNGNYNSSTQTILISDPTDNTPPTTPTISSIETDTGAADFSTTDTSLVINGTFDSSDAAGGFTVEFGGYTFTLGIDAQLVASGNNWSLTYPYAASSGTVTASAKDSGNNQSSASQVITIVPLDSTAPSFSSAATSTDGTKVILTYDEALSSTTAAASTFAVTTAGAANSVTAVAISGSTVELTLTNTVKNDQAVTVAYTDPSASNDTNAIQDAAGNDVVSLTATAVTNNSTVAGTAPSFSSAATSTDGTKVILTYDEALSSTTAAASTFAVTTAGAANSVTAVAISGSTVELTLTNTVKNDQAVTVAYTDPSASNDTNAIQDAAGNDVVSLTATAVTNNSTVAFSSATASQDNSSDKFYKFTYNTTSGSSITPIINSQYGTFNGDIKLDRLLVEPTFNNKPSGLSIGKTGLNFSLTLGNAAINNTGKVSSDLTALLDGLTTNGKYLAYYSYSSSEGSASSVETLTYDPTKKAGAKFYDINNDGVADKVTLELIDGGYGDKDQLINGTILDPSTTAAVTLSPTFSASTTALTIADTNDLISPAAFNLNLSISSNASTVNQIGYVALNSNENDTLTYDLIKDRGVTIISNIENEDVPIISEMNLNADISVMNNQKLVFFEVIDTSLQSLFANNTTLEGFGDSFKVLNLSSTTTNSSTASNGGNVISISLQSGFSGVNDLIASDLSHCPILDFTGLAGSNVEGTVSIAREADYDSTVGFYKIQNSDGAVKDSITGNLILPGSENYNSAALNSDNLFTSFSNLTTSDESTVTSQISSFSALDMIAPYASISNTDQTYFAFSAANSDGISHFREFGNGVIGLEDMKGGGDQDFDDLIFGFDFKIVSS